MVEIFQSLGYGHFGNILELSDLFHGQLIVIAETYQLLILNVQFCDGLSQFFKL